MTQPVSPKGLDSQDWLPFRIRLRHVLVVVDKRRIEEFASDRTVDAIVSSDDTSLSMSGGVSKAILEAAGSVLKEQARGALPLRMGDVAVTSGGALPISYVLHAVTLDVERRIRPTEQTLRSIARSVFGLCEQLEIARIAVPAIAVGAARFPPERSARIVLESLAEHATSPTRLQQVVFCLPDDNARRALIEELSGILVSASWAHGTGTPRASREPTHTRDHVRTPLKRKKWRAILDYWWPKKPDRSPTVGDRYLILDVVRQGGMGTVYKAWDSVAKRLVVIKEFRDTTGRHELHEVDEVDTQPSNEIDGEFLTERNRPSRPLVNGRYVLLEEIGRGGMGVVYLSWDIVLRHTLAIKTLQPGQRISRDRIERIKKEAALQLPLAHEAIVRLFHFEPWSPSVGPYLIMEFVPWTTGDRWIAEAGSDGLPPHMVIDVGLKLCAALASAHDAGVLHGDIKPSNIFIDPSGEQAKLADFGIATALGPKRQDAVVTRLIGTPAYMAPEQRIIGAKVGPWTDVYMLAGTLWSLMTGQPPGTPQTDPMTTIANRSLLATLHRGLAERVDQRPQDARQFAALLTECH